jgi:hypothetical protein
MSTRCPKGTSESLSNTALVMVIRTTHEAAVKNSIPKQNRVIVNGRIPLESDRDAICDWAERSDPTLTRSHSTRR